MRLKTAFHVLATLTIVSAGAVPGCFADPIFTINPVGATPTPLDGASFIANSIQFLDYSTITFTGFTSSSTASFTENGFLPVAISASPDLGRSGGFGLYVAFNATGSQSLIPDGSGNLDSTLTSLDFTLYGYNQVDTSGATFNTLPTGTTVAGNTPGLEALATGALISGTGDINSAGSPQSLFGVTFTPTAGGVGFFASPSPFYTSLDVTLSSTPLGTGETNAFGSGVAGCRFTGCPNTGFTTNQGSGSATFVAAAPAPEPGTYGLIACGLLGLAYLRKRK